MNKIERNDFVDYKDILLLDQTIRDTEVTALLPLSRYRIVLSGYLARYSIHLEYESLIEKYSRYVIEKINDRGNVYLINRDDSFQEPVGRCSCGRKNRVLSPAGECYYCYRTKNNYTTKIIA
jgi:hypothetical protein